MGNRLTKIYTKTGDDGTTGLGTGERVAKDDVRVSAYGRVDELNSHIGLLRAQLQTGQYDLSGYDAMPSYDAMLSQIQHELFNLGGELCMPTYELLDKDITERLEQQIDAFNANLPVLKDFILPAGSLSCAQAHVARSVCRHAERMMVTLHQRDNNVSDTALSYINRLSDWLFVFARVVARLDGGSEVLWQKGTQSSS